MSFTTHFCSENTLIFGVIIEKETWSFSRFDIAGEYNELYLIRDSSFQELIASLHTHKVNPNLKFVLAGFVFKNKQIQYLMSIYSRFLIVYHHADSDHFKDYPNQFMVETNINLKWWLIDISIWFSKKTGTSHYLKIPIYTFQR